MLTLWGEGVKGGVCLGNPHYVYLQRLLSIEEVALFLKA